MKSIVLIIPYFGEWPVWFDAHLLSIANNPSIHWLIVTDCDIPKDYPKNITFKSTSLNTLNMHINAIVKADVPLTPRKFCDLKPAYGAIFKDYIVGYDFWGFCDLDIVWGDIRKYITPELLEKYDVISSLENMISGHFTIFRNTEQNRFVYKNDPYYKDVFENEKHHRYDEVGFTKIVTDIHADGLLKVLWDKNILDKGLKSEVHQEYFLDRWLYKEGAIIDLQSPNHKEYMYLHFINWKRTMKSSEVKYIDQPDSFYISYSKMHYDKHNVFQKLWNRFTNLFVGYYVKEFKRIKKNRIKSLMKKIQRKLK